MDERSISVMVVLLLGVTQGLFLAILLSTKPVNKKANKLLAFLIISYSAFIVEQALAGTPITQRYPHLLGLATGIVFLQGPLHYLYARTLIDPRRIPTREVLLHLVPLVTFYLAFLFPFYLRSGPEKLAFMQSIAEDGLTSGLTVASWGVLLQGLIYMTMTLQLLAKHAHAIKESYSSVEKINLMWLRTITLLTLAVWVLGVVIEFLQSFGFAEPVQSAVPISITILIYVMGYLGLRQPEIFSDTPELAPEPRPSEEETKYKRSGLTRERAQMLHARLIELMETQRPFKDSSLKLNRLARLAAMSPNHLSQVINELRQQNFYDFVNGYRIDEAKRMILDPGHTQATMLSIAYEVGFNSKSAFNTAFKKHTGTTPSQFRRSHF